MRLSVVFVSGPRLSGKSVVIRAMIDRLWRQPPHFIRLVEVGGDKSTPRMPEKPPPRSGVATARALEYEPDRIFEILHETLAKIHHDDHDATVVIEADSDPILRCAYPYDHRLFVMRPPTRIYQVFRSAQEAAEEMQRVLEDTAEFASQVYGLFDADVLLDGEGREERMDMSGTQMRRFLATPLGDEIATRMAFQPPFHGLAESDFILVNTGLKPDKPTSEACLKMINRLLERLNKVSDRQGRMYRCDPIDPKDRMTRQLFKDLKSASLKGA
jgi:hypothetical protein